MKWLTIIVLLFASVLPSRGAEYKISMLPRYFPEKLTAMLSPLADYLSEKTGEDIKFVLTKNFADYENRVKSGEIAIAYQNPLVYMNVANVQEVTAIANKGKDGVKFRGIVITRPDSPITSLADLKNKHVMIVGETSAGGFLSQKLSLRQNNIDTSSITFESAADNRQENVIIAVSIGETDAGFIRESALHKADKYIMPGSIKTIAATAWLPNWAFSTNRSMDPALRDKIRSAVLALKADGKVLKALGLKGFNPASDHDYEIMRQLTP